MKYTKVDVISLSDEELQKYENRKKSKDTGIMIVCLLICIISYLIASVYKKESFSKVCGSLITIIIIKLIYNFSRVVRYICEFSNYIKINIAIKDKKVVHFNSEKRLLIYENEKGDICSISCTMDQIYNVNLDHEECIIDFSDNYIKMNLPENQEINEINTRKESEDL